MAKRILLVDDEPLIVKGLKYTLEQEGFETDSAADGDEALTKFFAGHYDFILLDTPGSVSDILPLAAPITDTALIVSSPQATAVRGAQRAGDVLAQMGVEDLALIVNQYDFSAKKADPVSDRLTLIEMIDRISIRLLGVIPFCSRVWKDQNDGVLITDASYRKNDFAQSFSNIAKRLEHMQIPLLSGFRRNK